VIVAEWGLLVRAAVREAGNEDRVAVWSNTHPPSVDGSTAE
jgi:hypothetical protein